jgi:hypothetical protein
MAGLSPPPNDDLNPCLASILEPEVTAGGSQDHPALGGSGSVTVRSLEWPYGGHCDRVS